MLPATAMPNFSGLRTGYQYKLFQNSSKNRRQGTRYGDRAGY